MSNISIGITAMELFAYNPFRILGVAVNTPMQEIERSYQKMLDMSENGEISNYKTDFDFDSLPPFSRSAQTLKTAYAKLSSNGYRCFAYSDPEFSVSLNIDDIALNLRDITCYDCFLRCYMWLIINDRDMQERDLWIQLAKHIDSMILSSPDQWSKFFDSRFPQEMIDPGMAVYKSFYSTFCQIILLPIKEMVRGSMKCTTATEILECAKIDVNEEFEYIDIPQGNLPKDGEPAPKLKIALKDGEEYFDIKTGKMMHYSTDTEDAESNSFAEASNAPLDAEVLNAEEPAEEAPEEVYEEEQTAYEEPAPAPEPAYEEPVYEEPAPQPAYEEPQPEPVYEEPAPAEVQPEKPAEPEPAPAPAEEPKPVQRPAPRRRMERRAAEPAEEKKAPPKPTQPVAPKPEPLKLDNESTAQPQPSAPRRSFRSMRSQAAAEEPQEQTAQTQSDFNSINPFAKNKSEAAAQKHERRSPNGFTKLVKEAEKKEEERAAAIMEEESEEEDENLYTNALIEMLRSNQSRGETMKSVDTRHAIKNGDSLEAPAKNNVSMDAINMDKYNDKLLAAPYEMTPRKLTREERYRNVKIDDMLNPGGAGKNYAFSAIEQFKKNKEKEKQNRKTIFALLGVLAVCLAVFALMFLYGLL